MSQKFTASQVITKDGEYRVRARRTTDTDLLSVYVNRVKKFFSEGGDEVAGTLMLEAGDLVESTGDLSVE